MPCDSFVRVMIVVNDDPLRLRSITCTRCSGVYDLGRGIVNIIYRYKVEVKRGVRTGIMITDTWMYRSDVYRYNEN